MRKYLPFFIIVLLIAASDAALMRFYKQQVVKQQQTETVSVAGLQKQISTLQSQLTLVSQQANSKLSAQEVVTKAVSKATPAVVSIVVTEDVPLYHIVYKNPFGNDPFFKDSDIQVPVYEPTGQSQSQKIGAASGFVISSDGYILTNKHVVANDKASYTVLLPNGKQQSAQVIYKDSGHDIAILKISGNNYKTIQFGDSKSLQLGQTVIAIGNALGQYNNTVSMGVVSGLDRTIQASSPDGSLETLTGVIQTDAAINPGNSGGPLLDLDGNAIGINVATVQGSSNVSFSIPENTVRGIIKKVINR